MKPCLLWNCTFYNLGLFALIGFCVWYLKTPWPLLGLIMVKQIKRPIEQ